MVSANEHFARLTTNRGFSVFLLTPQKDHDEDTKSNKAWRERFYCYRILRVRLNAFQPHTRLERGVWCALWVSKELCSPSVSLPIFLWIYLLLISPRCLKPASTLRSHAIAAMIWSKSHSLTGKTSPISCWLTNHLMRSVWMPLDIYTCRSTRWMALSLRRPSLKCPRKMDPTWYTAVV